jgi:catechol 2,3-dioxygenase-like lactoylglutathione lyase family enzyme
VDLLCSDQVGLWVEDQDRAKEFRTETVGFDLIRDAPYSTGEDAPDQRWIEGWWAVFKDTDGTLHG